MRFKDEFGREFELHAKWMRLLLLVRQICDAILEAIATAESWAMFKFEQLEHAAPQSAYSSPTYFPKVWLEAGPGEISLYIWPSTPDRQPDWQELQKDEAAHIARVAEWEQGARIELNIRSRAIKEAMNRMKD